MSVQLPNYPVPLIDPKTGQISVPWFKALGTLAGTVTGALVSSVNLLGQNGITVAGGPITTAGTIVVGVGNLSCASAAIAGTLTAANVSVGNIAASGTLTVANVVATVAVSSVNLSASSSLTTANAVINGTLTSSRAIIVGTITASAVVATATCSAVNIASTGTITANNVVIGGSVTFANPVSVALASDVSLTNTTSYFTGVSVSVGGTGTWYVSTNFNVWDTAGFAGFNCRLWDTATIIGSCRATANTINNPVAATLSGTITAPAGPLTLMVRDLSSGSGAIRANITGDSKDTTITAWRIA